MERRQSEAAGDTFTDTNAMTAPVRPIIKRKPLPATASQHVAVNASGSGGGVPPLPPRPAPASASADDGGVAQMLARMPADMAASIAAEHPLFQEIRVLVLLASRGRVEDLCTHLENSTGYHADSNEAQALMDWVHVLKDMKNFGPGEPFPLPRDQLRTAHYMIGSIVKTSLLDENVKTKAQRLALELPVGAPTHRSYFEVNPITFAYDAGRYQSDFNYRHWIGERVLGMTDTTSLDAWQQELTQRYHNRPRMGVLVDPNPHARNFLGDHQAEAFFGAMQRHNQLVNAMVEERNNALGPQTTGWARHPGVVGPALLSGITALPKLPELHTGTAGEAPPDDQIYLSQTKRFPMARNWTTLEEFFRFPLSLRAVSPIEFRQPPGASEVLFTDRFGVTMLGVGQTAQCTHLTEHDIFTWSIAKLQGYDQTLASHGITYEDYRLMILGLLYIIYKSMEGPEGRTNPILTGVKLKKFFDGVTENLRARGSPVVIKYKKDSKYHMSQLSVRHHPFDVLIRGRLGKRLNPKPVNN